MNKHLYLCHLLVLSSPTLMMHGHTNLKLAYEKVERGIFQALLSPPSKLKILKTSVVIQDTWCELNINNNYVFWNNYEVQTA